MNTDWSSYVQGINTLYLSRCLRFHDMFRDQFLPLFQLNADKPLRILEIGCGPGALAGALHRWYPRAEITAMDRDSAFIRFARENVPGVTFIEGDATALPFADGTFDVTISNTVAEHIEPSAFYGEQRRVLKDGGVCIVLTSRRGIQAGADSVRMQDEEEAFWKKAGEHDDAFERFSVGKYAMSESKLPAAMEARGFADVRTGYALMDLTPDDPKYPADMARMMIEAFRANDLDALDSVPKSMPGVFTEAEISRMRDLANARYDARLRQYEQGDKQWDTSVNIIMCVRGVKRA